MPSAKSEVLQGTLDLLVLKTLDSMGPMHGFGIALRIQQVSEVSEDLLPLNQGTLYPALLRLEQRGWIFSKWGTSENNRKAKFYSLTRAGSKQFEQEAESWDRMSDMINRVLRTSFGNLLYKVSPRDLLAFESALAVMTITPLAACFLPAWRATRTDPARALRD